jgi:vacuolar-type H+-ATPase subunit E/Vma4
VSSSLEKLVEEIISESKTKADEIRKRGQSEANAAIEAARTEVIREADSIIRDSKSDVEAARNRIASQERQKARIAYLAEKNKVVQHVLKDVQARLLELVENEPSYRPFLLKAIARGVEAIPSEDVKVALCERDLKRFKSGKLLDDALAATQTRKKVIVVDRPIETAGGAVVTSQDGKTRVDCTLEGKLKLMEPQILTEISQILFAS